MTEIVRAEGITKRYGDFVALSDVSFSIDNATKSP